MIFLTVGTQFGFNRLVKAVDEAIEQGVVQEAVFAQIGPGSYLPKRMEYVLSLDKKEYDKILNSCEAMISHAGMGSISLTLKMGKPLLVMPRSKQFREVVNDHQIDTARKFEELGHILVAWDERQLQQKIQELGTFVPRPRNAQPETVATRIREFIDGLADQR